MVELTCSILPIVAPYISRCLWSAAVRTTCGISSFTVAIFLILVLLDVLSAGASQLLIGERTVAREQDISKLMEAPGMSLYNSLWVWLHGLSSDRLIHSVQQGIEGEHPKSNNGE